MRRWLRKITARFGPAAPQVAVRPQMPLYWRVLVGGLLVAFGFSTAYMKYARGNAAMLQDELAKLEQENRMLHTRAIHVEQQQQVTTVAQHDLSKDLASLQEENVQLKEDVAFYKSILEDSTGVAVIKLHSFKVAHGSRPGEFQYRLLLVQSGKHDKNVQGSLQLSVLGMQDGKPVTLALGDKNSQYSNSKVNFKYYQPIEGSFTIPEQVTAQSLQARFFQTGSNEPKLTQSIPLTN